jgi:linoleoyl-CoA desaturase
MNDLTIPFYFNFLQKMNASMKVRFVRKDQNQFFPTLRKRVDQYFKETGISKNANSAMVIKTVVLLASYIIPFITIIWIQPALWISMLLWVFMGFGLAGIGMSVMHDACHGAYSKNKLVNDILGHTLNLCGGSTFNWKLQHNVLHHTYTNVTHLDEDIDDKLVLKFSPHTDTKSYHRFQWIYAFFFYGILTLYWVFGKDFVQFFRYIKKGVNTNTPMQNVLRFIRILGVKAFYVALFFWMPIAVFGLVGWHVVVGFLLMHFVAGFILTTTFQLAHTVEGTEHPLPNADGEIENEWAIHQLQTTVNFARHNKLLSWYMGGLNYQVEHHLFPNISHIHYPNIADIVKNTAEEFGIPYLENTTLMDAVRSHVNMLKKLGKLPDINEALA